MAAIDRTSDNNYYFYYPFLSFVIISINLVSASFGITVVVGPYVYVHGSTISIKRRKEDYL